MDANGTNALFQRVGEGDRAAFAALYDQTASLVYGEARRVLRDPAQAEEVAQEVLLEAWRTAPRYDQTKGCAVTCPWARSRPGCATGSPACVRRWRRRG